MPGYLFDQNLVPSVLADPVFQRTGLYMGDDRGLYYCVIDPRRRVVNVWQKQRINHFGLSYGLNFLFYRMTALASNFAFFTNGPMMSPPPSATLPKWMRILVSLWPTTWPLSSQIRWHPMNLVVHKGAVIDQGIGSPGGLGHFARTGQGRYQDYLIAQDPMPAPGAQAGGVKEGIQGLTLLVRNGAVATHTHALTLQTKIGVAVWAKVPLNPPVPTQEWQTEVDYLNPYEGEGQTQNRLDGVLISAATDTGDWNMTIASDMLRIGASDVVATDPSDSVLCGSRASLFVPCATVKDAIQDYGLAVM